MKLSKRFAIFAFSIMLLGGLFAFGAASDVSAQTRGGKTRVVYYPVYVRDPFYWGSYNRFYDPYGYNPYYSVRRERNYLESIVRRERGDMAEHNEEFYADGVITAKEAEQVRSDRRQLAEALENLRDFNASYSRRY